jgi:drug/metabolite transporter (DMT)-like permease
VENHVFLAVLAAAVMHAGWNVVLKQRADRQATMMVFIFVGMAVSVVVLPFVEAPARAAWPWILASGVLHAGYKLFLLQAYAHADLSQAYPLARGSAPLIVALVSMLWLGEVLQLNEAVAVLCISGGLLLMAFKGGTSGRMRGQALFYALGTACFTAGYTLTDGYGARIAGAATGYLMWLMLVDGVVMVTSAAATQGQGAFTALKPAWKVGVIAGLLSTASYWVAMWAFTQAPIALVAALRESSILFAVIIAAVFLREPVTRWRWGAALCIGLGVVLLKL